MKNKIEWIQYVPRGFVDLWENMGWVSTGILSGTHHDYYAVAMTPGPDCKFKEDGEPCVPKKVAA